MDKENPLLPRDDKLFLDAGEGWHMMGNYKAAEYEVSQISPENWEHPDVLHLRSRVYWGLRKIAMALSTATRFIEQCPDHSFGYIFKAQVLIYDGRAREGYELLLAVHTKFPQHSGFPFQLAECAAEVGLWSEALHWLTQAISQAPYLKAHALDIKMFEPIWSEIRAIQPQQ